MSFPIFCVHSDFLTELHRQSQLPLQNQLDNLHKVYIFINNILTLEMQKTHKSNKSLTILAEFMKIEEVDVYKLTFIDHHTEMYINTSLGEFFSHYMDNNVIFEIKSINGNVFCELNYSIFL